MEVKVGLYSVGLRLSDGGIQYALPFVAANHDFAKQMVVEAFKKNAERADLSKYELHEIAAYYPEREHPVVKTCASKSKVFLVSDIFAELMTTPLEVADE